MSYLLQMVRRRSLAPPTPLSRVDEYARLNRPGLYGDAFVRVYVGDTSTARRRQCDPGFVLQIADCVNMINLEFSVSSPELRENSLFKIDTLLGALQRFRTGLVAEAELAEGK